MKKIRETGSFFHIIFFRTYIVSGETMTLLFSILILSGIFIGIFALKKMKFTQILLVITSGISALLACDFVLSLFGQNMPVNLYTLSISAVGGIPGVILLSLLKTIII